MEQFTTNRMADIKVGCIVRFRDSWKRNSRAILIDGVDVYECLVIITGRQITRRGSIGIRTQAVLFPRDDVRGGKGHMLVEVTPAPEPPAPEPPATKRQFCTACLASCVPAVSITYIRPGDELTGVAPLNCRLHLCEEHACLADGLAEQHGGTVTGGTASTPEPQAAPEDESSEFCCAEHEHGYSPYGDDEDY